MKLLVTKENGKARAIIEFFLNTIRPLVQSGQRIWISWELEKRTTPQNAKFHAICGDIAKSGLEWMGKKRSAAQWKVLLVSGHAAATKEEFDIVPGLEGEFVNLRESTALMSIPRSTSLIEYSIAFCAMKEITLSDPNEYERMGLPA